MSYTRLDAGETGKYTGTLKDADGVVIPLTSISALTLTLTDAATGTAIRSSQDVLNAHNVTVHATTGAVAWSIQAADTALVTSGAASEEHVAEFTCTFSGGVLKFEHRIFCSSVRELCTFDDVALQRPNLADADRSYIEVLIDSFTRQVEIVASRLVRVAARTETFSPVAGQRAVQLAAYPVSSVSSVKESLDGDFSTVTALPASEYHVNADGVLRLRWRAFFEGAGSVQVVYTGGLARDVGAVPADLRVAAARQVAYWSQRRGQLGVTSESVGGQSVTTFAQDLLPDVERVVRSYAMPWVV